MADFRHLHALRVTSARTGVPNTGGPTSVSRQRSADPVARRHSSQECRFITGGGRSYHRIIPRRTSDKDVGPRHLVSSSDGITTSPKGIIFAHISAVSAHGSIGIARAFRVLAWQNR